MTQIEIREMRSGDVIGSVLVAMQVHPKTSYRGIPVDVGVSSTFLMKSLLEKDTKAWVAEKSGKVVGFVVGQLHQWFFSPKYFATMRVFIVSEEGKGAGARLLFRFMAWAKGFSKVTTINLHASAGTEHQADVERMFGKLGKRAGSIFHIEV